MTCPPKGTPTDLEGASVKNSKGLAYRGEVAICSGRMLDRYTPYTVVSAVPLESFLEAPGGLP